MYEHLETVLNTHAYLGEGIWWDERAQRLYWVDILNKEIHRLNPYTAHDTLIKTAYYVGFTAPRENGTLIAGIGKSLCFVDFDTNRITEVMSIEADKPNNRFNDGKCGPGGRLWAGTMSNSLNEAGDNPVADGAFYCFDADLKAQCVFTGQYISNGIAFSPGQRKMYHIDTMTQQIRAYDMDISSGMVSNGRPVATIPASMGSPDGMTIDEQGMLWVARWEGYGVSRYNPKTGEELLRINVPVKNVTCCAFGGKNFDELYITTSRIDADIKAHPLSGSVFVAKTGFAGNPVYRFMG